MNLRSFLLSATVAFASLAGVQLRGANMATVSVAPLTGVVAVTPRWVGPNFDIGGTMAGFHFMAQDLSLGGGATQFYSLTAAAIPAGGNSAAFKGYIASSGAANDKATVGSQLTPNSYSALTSADPDIGYGAVNFYTIHHKGVSDYFTVIKPGTAPSVADLKPMSGPGGPLTVGTPGYFALTFAAANVGQGQNLFYYLRTDSVTSTTFFGKLDPALLNTSTDLFNLGSGGFAALLFTGSDVGYGIDKFYYLRLDSITGFTVFGTLDPVSGKTSDIANLGSVYHTLTFAPGDVGFGSGRFYVTGATNPNEQSISFAAIADKAVNQQFTVSPSASSGLDMTLTVVAGSTGAATISGPSAGVFTVTPTSAGVVTLQASQAGGGAIEANHLRQRFTIAGGSGSPVVSASPSSQTVTTGSPVTFTVVATGTPPPTTQWTLNGAAIAGATSPTLTISSAQAANSGIYRATVTNSVGSTESTPAVLGLTSTSKVTGSGTEVGANIVHPNGNTYDQVLLTGAAATVTADAGQILRVSFVDLSNDIVQVEFSGAGTLAIVLDGVSGPAVAQNYNQPSVSYMKGNARIVLAGTNETTNLSIFSVGRITAVNQTLFRSEVSYDGVADVASAAILTTNGKFDGLRSANTSYFATAGYTGVYAPGVQFAGPVYIGDINASDNATGAIMLTSSSKSEINGGDALQSNTRAVQVSSMTQVHFVAGMTSHGGNQAAQVNRARFEQNGADVTSQIVVNP